MPHRNTVSVIVLCYLLAPAAAFSQFQAVQPAIQPLQNNLAQVQPKTGAPQTIVLPKVLVAGEKATLAVVDAAGRLVPAVDLELSTGAKLSTDDTGRLTFQAPATPGIFTAHIIETAQDFKTAVVSIPKDSATARELIYPHLIALQERFDVLGTGFSGEAYLDSVVLGNLPALVVAASPVSLVAQPNPRANTGPSELVAGLAAARLPAEAVTVVSLEVVAPTQPLSPGEESAIAVRASGTNQRLLLDVRSMTPEVVNIARGRTDDVPTSGGTPNAAKIKLRVLRAGAYSLNARLAMQDATDIEAARQQILAASQLADARWQKSLDQLMRQMLHARDNPKDADAQSAARFRQQIERLLHDRPPEPVAGLVRMAGQSLGLDSD